jgi:Protein of unknown function (DUF3987)
MSTHTLQHPSTTVDQDASTLAQEQDRLTRWYLDLLVDDMKPAQRPDCGRWLPLVEMAEDAYTSSSNGNRATAVAAVLDSLATNNAEFRALLEGTETAEIASALDTKKEEEPSNMPALPDIGKLPEGQSRGASSLMTMYVNYSREISPEGYEGFHEGGFFSMLSTINARRTKIPLRDPEYCSLMIGYVAESTDYAKTTTAKAVEKVLEAAGLSWFLGAGKTTPQRLIQEMSGIVPKDYLELESRVQEYIQMQIAFAGQRGWHPGEMGKTIKAMMNGNSAMADFLGFLLEMDDNKDHYKNATISRNTEVIEKPYLSILGCMTPPDLKSNAKAGAEFWNDGFWARWAFICPPENSNIDSPMELGEFPPPADLVHALKRWHYRLGVPTITIEPVRDDKEKIIPGKFKITRDELLEETIQFGEGVDDARKRYRSALKQLAKDSIPTDLKSSYGRLPVKALRIAALLGSLENQGRIEMCHWALAQEIAEKWRVSLHRLYSQINAAPDLPTQASRLGDKILEVVKKLEGKGKPPTVKEIHDYIKWVDVGKLKMAVLDFVRIGQLQEDKLSRKFPCYSIIEEG